MTRESFEREGGISLSPSIDDSDDGEKNSSTLRTSRLSPTSTCKKKKKLNSPSTLPPRFPSLSDQNHRNQSPGVKQMTGAAPANGGAPAASAERYRHGLSYGQHW